MFGCYSVRSSWSVHSSQVPCHVGRTQRKRKMTTKALEAAEQAAKDLEVGLASAFSMTFRACSDRTTHASTRRAMPVMLWSGGLDFVCFWEDRVCLWAGVGDTSSRLLCSTQLEAHKAVESISESIFESSQLQLIGMSCTYTDKDVLYRWGAWGRQSANLRPSQEKAKSFPIQACASMSNSSHEGKRTIP